MLSFVPQSSRLNYNSIDLYNIGMTVLYSGKTFDPKIVQTDLGFIIPHPLDEDSPLKDLHDTYKVDRFENIYGGHTTATDNNNNKERMDHDDQ